MSFHEFGRSVAKTIVAYGDWLLKEQYDQYSDAMVRAFVHKDETARLPKMPPQQQAFLDVVAFDFQGLREVRGTLTECVNYLRMLPPLGVEPSAYLRYHVEHWLHTTYVLRERTSSYISRVAKLFKGTELHAEIRALAPEAKSAFDDTLGIIYEVRGHHVHVSDVTPPQVAELTFYEQFVQVRGYMPNHPSVPQHAEVLKEWAQEFTKANEGIDLILDAIFEALHPLVFDGDKPRDLPVVPAA